MVKLTVCPGIFNWTMTFRTNSDVPVPYGRFIRRVDKGETDQDFNSSKPLLVATLQSHCESQSGRFDYIDQLIKHIQVRPEVCY